MSETVHVRVSTGFRAPTADKTSNLAGGARPTTWLGALAPGGLTLPAADPTADQMYAPRGVWLDDQRVVVADTGNHRIMIWDAPDDVASHSPAAVVLGQPDMKTEGAQAGGRGPERGMRLPTGVVVHDGRLVVADAWNHRILIWDSVPDRSDRAPDVVLGQPDAGSVDENRGGECGPLGFYWPFGVAMAGDSFWVADTGNRRVLGWHEIPGPDTPPDVVLGQPDAVSREENAGGLGPSTFRWPHDIAALGSSAGDRFFVADAGNHRLLGWNRVPEVDEPAADVHGQPDFETAAEFPYAPQSATSLRFPYAVDIVPDDHQDGGDQGAVMAVADTANNRVVLWDHVPMGSGTPAERVLGQHDFTTSGENRWDLVDDDTFCWPYGLSLDRSSTGTRLAVADSGNNRVMIWELR